MALLLLLLHLRSCQLLQSQKMLLLLHLRSRQLQQQSQKMLRGTG